MSLLILFIIAVYLLVYAVKVSRRNKEEPEKYQTAEAPTHFDLLDDNGDPISASDAPVQELQYFCIKDKGYHVSVWPKNQGIQGLDYIEFNIAGITHCENVDGYLGEFKGTLEAEPTNEYDPNAIKVLAADGHHVGYVPKDMTDEIRDNVTLPCQCFCYIGENDGVYFSDCYILRPNVSPK
jgi:hypothetical protein